MGKKIKKQICDICGSTTDIYTNAHSKSKFVDYKLYDKVCFTCYFVPKTNNQKYDREGYVSEDLEIDYSSENLNTPKELVSNGHAESLKEAKKSYEAVKNICSKKHKKNNSKLFRPKPDWRIVV